MAADTLTPGHRPQSDLSASLAEPPFPSRAASSTEGLGDPGGSGGREMGTEKGVEGRREAERGCRGWIGYYRASEQHLLSPCVGMTVPASQPLYLTGGK